MTPADPTATKAEVIRPVQQKSSGCGSSLSMGDPAAGMVALRARIRAQSKSVAGQIITGDPALAMTDLTVVLQPTPTNSCTKVSDLLPQNLTCVAKTRITAATESRITPAELRQLRQLVVLAIGGIN